nr:hypothetical protein [Tanacetum cinerariifolium]
MASSTIPVIYIQQFKDTMHYDITTGIYSCQLDEQWFNLHKDIFRDALQITPINDNNPFMAPLLSDAVIEYVNNLGYPVTLKNMSAMSVNDLYQPWRAILSIINMCLTEFVQSIQTFLTDKKRLPMASHEKNKSTPLIILSIRFTKLIIHHLKTKYNIHLRTGLPLHYSHEDNVLGNLMFVGKDSREVFGMPIPDALLTDAIFRAPYYGGYLAYVTKYQRHLDGKYGMVAAESPAPKASKPKTTSSQPPKPKSASTKPSKVVPEKKRKLVKVTPDEPSPAKRLKASLVGKRRKPKSPLKLVDDSADKGVPIAKPRLDDEEADLQQGIELSLKEFEARNQSPARSVVFREPDSGRFQPLPKVQGKGKEKVIEKQAARDLLTLQTPKKKSPVDQYIFQRQSPTTTGPSGNAELPSLDAELADSETESDKTVTPVNKEKDASNRKLIEINAGGQDEVQAGSNPSKQDKGQDGSNPEPEKTNAESEVQSMITVPIHKDTSSVPPMNTPKSLERDYSNQLRVDLDEARRKKIMKHNFPRTSFGSPPPQPPPLPPPAGASGAPGTLGASGSSQLYPPPPPPSTDTNRGNQQHGSETPSSSKSAASTPQSMAWTTFDTRYESVGFAATHETSPIYYLMNDDSIPDEQVHVSDDEDTGNDHLPKVNMRKDRWKPLPEEDRPATPKPALTIPSFNVSDVDNNWTTALASTYMEECHKMFIDQITWVNPKSDQVRIDVSRPLPLYGLPGLVTIQTQLFFNKVLDHLRYGNKGSKPALLISKMKVARYLDFGLELLVPEQIWINEVCTYDISAAYGISHWWFNRQKFYIDRHDSSLHRREVRKHMQIFSVVRIKVFLRYKYDYLSEIIIRRADFQEHKISKKDFKNLYPNNFKDLNLLLLQGYLNHLSGSEKRMLSTAIKL